MPPRRKLLVVAGGLAVTVLAALVVLPLAFKDRLEARARAELDRALDARGDWSGVGLTFFRDFPNLTLGLDDLTVVGIDRFEGDTLARATSFRFVLDVESVVRSLRDKGPVVVRSVRLHRPDLRLRMLDDGAASWNILRERDDPAAEPPPGADEGRSMEVELRRFEIADGRVVFEDDRSGSLVALGGLRHTLEGNFSRDRLVVDTRTHADSTTVRFAGTPWLSNVALDFDAAVDADLERGRFAFGDNELRLNELALGFTGEALRGEDVVTLDVSFAAPGTDFERILSLVPAVYEQDFASLESSGTFALEGWVRGALGGGAFPALALRVSVEDGSFRYPDLPLPAEAIALDLAVDNPGGDADSTVVDLRRLHAEIGGRPMELALSLRTPVSDPLFDARVRGSVDLADLRRTVELDDVRDLSGVVTAEASVRGRRSDVQNERYDRIVGEGTLSARDVVMAAADVRHAVAVDEANLELSPGRADLRAFRGRIGGSDVQATGWVENLLGFALWEQPLRGAATVHSGTFVLDEWRSEEPDREVVPVPERLDLTIDGTVERLLWAGLEMTDARGRVTVRERRATLDGFTLDMLGGRVGVAGFYETLDPARPTFDVDLTIDSLDIARASEALLTVRELAPVSRWARGTFSADLDLTGAFGADMAPVFDVLEGGGSLLTSRIAIEGFPLLERLADALEAPRLSNPTFEAVRSSVAIRGGRLHVQPFQVGTGPLTMTVSGSNGVDRSLDYVLAVAVPHDALGSAADRVLEDLAARVGRAGLDLAASDSLRLGVRVTGTVSDPALELGFDEAVASLRERAGEVAEEAVEARVDEARALLNAERAEAVERARVRGDSLVAEAERRAEQIRAEAVRLAEQVRAEGDRRAEEVLAQATNPLARRAAEPVAERIRREADEEATRLESEADRRATAVVEEARRQADALVREAGGGDSGGAGSDGRGLPT